MIKVKIAVQGNEIICAMCDAELIGKRFVSGKNVLDLDKYGSFYDGDNFDDQKKGDKEKVLKLTRSASSINAVGKRSIALLKEIGYSIDNVIKIADIPHLQMYKI